MTNKEAQIVIGNIPIKPEILDDCYDITEYQEAKAMAIEALEQQQNIHDTCKKCVEFSEFKEQPKSLEQIKWERDTAINQLKELGYGFGEKIEKCDDCISRTNLIAVMHLIMDDAKIGDNDEDYESLDDIKEQYIEIAKGLTSVQPEMRWIPVSEKLPNRGDAVIATFVSKITENPFVTTIKFLRDPKEVVKDSNIIAWMPIIKPFKESEK